jgi:glyoxylase-like metal-dependent hydrolase (beta-lactamase superfamily II)
MTAGADRVALVPNGGWDERVLVFRNESLVDVFAVVTQRYVVLVDTLATPAAAAAVLDYLRPRLASRRLLVVNTHADWDHCWGNAVFDGPAARWPAPIIGHRRCRERLASAAARAELAQAQARAPARFGAVRLVPPSLTFARTLTIDGGDLTLALLHTPGHQPDHLAVWLPEARLLLAGDTAEAPFPSVAGPAGVPALRASLRRLAALAPATLLACHAPGVTSPDLLAANAAYLDELERRGRAALARGLPADLPAGADPAALIGYPAEAAAAGTLPDGQADYYRRAHGDAIRAMLGWLANAGERAGADAP